ncbi:copper homeostasis protein [Penicillium lividum]|nr:copper homeostasis protein [Penicillium lividum]
MNRTCESRRPLLEIACFNGESGVHAEQGGADRIELCCDYTSGGLSPDPAVLSELKARVAIPVYVMIRPRANDFFYSNEEFEVMKSTMMTLRNAGADGFVFGILNQVSSDNPTCSWIDERNKQLVQLAGEKPCTFHRAFDCIPGEYWGTALKDLAKCGFASILTSGGPSGDTAIECVDRLAELFQQVDLARSQIPAVLVPEIIVGGGVRSSNIQLLWERTHARAFHSSALVTGDCVEFSEVKNLVDSLSTASIAKD